MGIRRVKVSWFDPPQSEWWAMPNWPQRVPIKNLVQIMMFESKNSIFWCKKPTSNPVWKFFPCHLLNLDGLWVQQVSYMKFSVNIRWGWVWPVPIGQKHSPPILVVYPNKSETLIQQFIHLVYLLRSTFLPCLGRLQGWAGYFSGRWVPAIPGPIWY